MRRKRKSTSSWNSCETQLTAAGATVDKVEKWGKRRLAYRVDKYREGAYVLLEFTAEAETVKELERRLRVSDMVIKFLTVRIDQTRKRLDKRKKAARQAGRQRAANVPRRPATAPGRATQMRGAPAPEAPAMPGSAEGGIKTMAEFKGRPGSAGQRPTGGDKAVASQKKQYFRRKKVCRFCVEKIDDINYKDTKTLHAFVAERGKIVPRRISGVCAPHQRRLTDAIKKARNIALLPFAAQI